MQPSSAILHGTTPLRSPAPTLIEALELAAREGAPLLTLHGQGEPRRYGARDALLDARGWAARFSEHTEPGEPIAILLPTSVDFVGALLGAMAMGRPPLPLAAPMTFGPVDRYVAHLARILEHAGARVVVTTPRVAEALAKLPIARELAAVLVPGRASVPAHVPWLPSLAASDTALLQYTSGTTGRPKGARISHRALTSNVAAIADALSLRSDDVGVSWLPLHHDMGLVGALLTAVTFPYELHLLPPEAFVMRPRRWLELVHTYRATISTAPNFAYDLTAKKASAEGLDLSSWRAALDGAEPVHAATLARFADRFAGAGLPRRSLTPVYGLAEATLAVTFHPSGLDLDLLDVDRTMLEERGRALAASGERARTLVGVGSPITSTAVRIVREDGSSCASGEVGEIVVRGPGLMDGYHRDEEASARAIVDGWLHTGDLGLVANGRLFVTGRRRELIIQAGRNVHPEDVEHVARETDARIGAAAALAVTAPARGTDELVLVLESRGLDAATREEVATRVRGEVLAAIGIRADHVTFWPLGSIPRTTSGKVQRSACAAAYERKRGESRDEEDTCSAHS